ncbi:glutamyl-tRNA reductase [Leucobacter weissii]|uniref:Glutamyl-tRNA reductase n=1 Tax=Leucobacter weissii TaxID=1983706 RepID=A0A939MNY5_9MICO|nr:glutamyl-tRNA reductase [Leucobacter weissii]MBO1902062.1 glutamyl-tRNA reductase [Leucobacter weissii]
MLLCLSIDHHRIDLGILERIERHADELAAALGSLRAAGSSPGEPAQIRGSVPLITCNRFEVYLQVSSETGIVDAALDEIARITGLSREQLSRAMAVYLGGDVAEHLFSVSSGLESAVVGEGEISGQVRKSLEQARATGRVSSDLERLFQLATRTSREIKNRTELQSKGRSLVRLALRMAESRIGDWGSARVLLIGTGAYAGASLAALRARGAKHIGVFSPSGRAERFADSHVIDPVPASALDTQLGETDLVVACTNTRDPLLTSDQFARTTRPGRPPFCSIAPARSSTPRPRLLIDMGLPRNIDPAAAGVPGVELLDLETVVKHAPIPELSAEAEARKIVSEAAAEFLAGRAENAAVPTLVALRDHVGDILQDELTRLGRGSGADPAVEAALRHFAGRILHQPTVRLRELARAGGADDAARAVELLFGLGSGLGAVDEPDAADTPRDPRILASCGRRESRAASVTHPDGEASSLTSPPD